VRKSPPRSGKTATFPEIDPDGMIVINPSQMTAITRRRTKDQLRRSQPHH